MVPPVERALLFLPGLRSEVISALEIQKVNSFERTIASATGIVPCRYSNCVQQQYMATAGVASNHSTSNSYKSNSSPVPSASTSSVHSQDGTLQLPPSGLLSQSDKHKDGSSSSGSQASAHGLAPPNSTTRPTLSSKKSSVASRLTRMFSHQQKESSDANKDSSSDGGGPPVQAPSKHIQDDQDSKSSEENGVVPELASNKPLPQKARRGSVDSRLGRTGSILERKRSNRTAEQVSPSKPPKRFDLADAQTGEHQHHLKSGKRQEKLSDMLREMMGGKKKMTGYQDAQPPTLMDNWVDQVRNEKSKLAPDASKGGPNSTMSLVEKYGKCQEVVGRGAFGIVRVAHKADNTSSQREHLFAVKEFRRKPEESHKKYQKRLTSEFCISSSMKHPNVIKTLDLLQDDKGDFCVVMEFCAGGDLYSLILSTGQLEVGEADCFFKQLMRGVDYLHDTGVAHRDLKPENLLLTQHGALKITDFGNGECFRMAWETEAHMTAGLCGSAPYIAPEEYSQDEFDARPVDVWACGVIYMAMRSGRHLWKIAQKGEDEFYERYLHDRREESGYAPIETLRRVSIM